MSLVNSLYKIALKAVRCSRLASQIPFETLPPDRVVDDLKFLTQQDPKIDGPITQDAFDVMFPKGWPPYAARRVTRHAASHGHASILQQCRARGLPLAPEVGNDAMINSQFHLLPLLIEWGIPLSESAVMQVIETIPLDVVELLYNHRNVGVWPLISACTLRAPRMDIVNALLDWGVELSAPVLFMIVRDAPNVEIIRALSTRPHLAEILVNDPEMGRAAVLSGRWMTVLFLWGLGVVMTHRHADWAAEHGHVAILKMLHVHGIDCSRSGMIGAGVGGHLNVVRLLRRWSLGYMHPTDPVVQTAVQGMYRAKHPRMTDQLRAWGIPVMHTVPYRYTAPAPPFYMDDDWSDDD